MNLDEYLDIRVQPMLTNRECQIFRIDTKKGWRKKYSKCEFTDYQIYSAIHHVLNTDGISEIAKKALSKYGTKFQTDDSNKYLYMARRDDGLIKIGISCDPKRRIRELTNGSGSVVELVAIWKTEVHVRAVESALLKKFYHLKTQGEWFKNDSISLFELETSIEGGYERIYINSGLLLVTNKNENDSVTFDYDSIIYETDKAKLFLHNGSKFWVAKSRIKYISETEIVCKNMTKKMEAN